jgi:DNA-binding PadR family transcriptional regulator
MASSTRLHAHWFHILLSLADRDLHGTAIMEDVLDRTEGRIRLWPGKLYSALRNMTDQGLIREVEPPDDAPTEGGKRRFYSITPTGHGMLREDVDRLAALVRLARAKAGGAPG